MSADLALALSTGLVGGFGHCLGVCGVGLIIVKYEDRKDARIGFILESLALKDSLVLDSLLKKGLMFLSRNKVDFVLARVSSSDPVKRAFYKKGFSPKEGVWNSHMVYVRYSSHVEDSILCDTSLWHVSSWGL